MNPVSHKHIERFKRDGVVKLCDVVSSDNLNLIRRGIQRNLQTPSPRFEERSLGNNAPRYCEDFWVWSEFEEFEQFVRHSPIGEIGGQLMGAQRANLVMDNWFLREAGTKARAPWHHDISYFDFDGTMCVVWIPLEAIGKQDCIELVRGSHLWNKLFMRVWFDGHEAAQAAGWVNGQYYHAPPPIEELRSEYEIVSFDMNPGDCLVFDIRTLHGSNPNSVPCSSQQRYTVRLADENARIRYRGDWAKQERQIMEDAGHHEGDEINSDFFPCLWKR